MKIAQLKFMISLCLLNIYILILAFRELVSSLKHIVLYFQKYIDRYNKNVQYNKFLESLLH